MKKIMIAALAVCLVLSPALALGATLRVSGSAVVTAAPDRATLEIGFAKDDADVGAALRRVAEVIEAVRAAVLAEGIPEENLKTSYLSTYPMHNWDTGIQATHYRVEHMLSIRVDDIALIGSVLDAALAAGANQGGHIRYDASGGEELYQEALTLAVENAASKANALAIAAGVWLGQLEQVNEQGSFIPFPVRGGGLTMASMDMAEMEVSVGDTLMAGDIEVTAMVELVYSIR